MKEFEWGWPVKWCRAFDPTGDFCTFCVLFNRLFHTLILKRNPTCIGWQPEPLTHDTEDANYI